MDLGDVRVAQGRQDFGFALEPRKPLNVARKRLRKHLESDLALEVCVGGAVDLTHSARANLGCHFVRAESGTQHEGHGAPTIVTTKRVRRQPNAALAVQSATPAAHNHGMAAGVNGRAYLIGGQTMADAPTYVDTVYELDPAGGEWVEKARMPTARSARVAVVHDGRIFVASGRPPRGSDFAVYDPRSDSSEGVRAQGLSPLITTAHQVFNPQSGSWTIAAFRRASLASSRVAGSPAGPLTPSSQKGWVFPGSVFRMLTGEVRAALPAAPGQPARHDSEFRRNGTANIFVALDAHQPRRVGAWIDGT
jgi:hypothetical protein